MSVTWIIIGLITVLAVLFIIRLVLLAIIVYADTLKREGIRK